MRKGCSAEDRTFVRLQDGEPGGDICRMVRARFEGDAEIRAEERCANFRDEFFASVSMIGKAFAEVTTAAMRG